MVFVRIHQHTKTNVENRRMDKRIASQNKCVCVLSLSILVWWAMSIWNIWIDRIVYQFAVGALLVLWRCLSVGANKMCSDFNSMTFCVPQTCAQHKHTSVYLQHSWWQTNRRKNKNCETTLSLYRDLKHAKLKHFRNCFFSVFPIFFSSFLVPPLKFNRNWMSNSIPPSPPPRLPLPTITTAHSTHIRKQMEFYSKCFKEQTDFDIFFFYFISLRFFLCACIVLHLISEIFWHEHRTCNQLAEINTKIKKKNERNLQFHGACNVFGSISWCCSIALPIKDFALPQIWHLEFEERASKSATAKCRFLYKNEKKK